MKGMRKVAIAALAALLFLQGIAEAKILSGKVVRVNPQAGEVTLSLKDLASGIPMEKTFAVSEETEYLGFAALEELSAGTEVSVTTREGEPGEAEELESIEKRDVDAAVPGE